jgi:hypothetical protein
VNPIKNIIVIAFLIMLSIVSGGCESNKLIKPDTPSNTAMIVKNMLMAKNYDGLKEVLTKGSKERISLNEFNKLAKVYENGNGSTDFKSYELLTFGDGSMILIHLTHIEDFENKVQVQDIKVIPEEMKSFFNEQNR